MDQRKKRLPVGIDDFQMIRTKNYYYVDKTGLIRDLVEAGSGVTLFTRPRRFGKSLNMSMLANFFSLDGDKAIFDGLEITKEKDLCEQYMGQYPVISLSLKGVDGPDYEIARQMTVNAIVDVSDEFDFLPGSEKLNQNKRNAYRRLLDTHMDDGTLRDSLKTLCHLLEKHFGKRVILLIDEYDVPLANAHLHGYYDQMISLIRALLGAALKTNKSLEFAVLTGCLRVSKESIFTGLNNLDVCSVTDWFSSEFFGFTEEEVKGLLAYYGFSDRFDVVKKWYDGYQFGNTEVYCPWDVLKYSKDLLNRPNAQPKSYWINTSENEVIKRLAKMADGQTRDEIERLIEGETIEKEIHEELTYSEIYKKKDNVWSLLFMTGYLTQRGEPNGQMMRLAIPNLEIRKIFADQIREYFEESVEADTDTLNRFAGALLSGNADEVENLFTQYLENTISVRDPAAPGQEKEMFYHATLLAILKFCIGLDVRSNRESGDGYPDILAKTADGRIGIVIEVKYARDGNLERSCREALDQIERLRYTDEWKDRRMKTVLKYAVACKRKSCRVMLG